MNKKQWLGPYYSGMTYKSAKEAKEAYQHYQPTYKEEIAEKEEKTAEKEP